MLRGRELVYGVASLHVPGCSATEKKDNLRKFNELQLQEMLTQHKAFRVALESGQALLMPPMFITIQACHSEEVAGVRWNVAAASGLTGESVGLHVQELIDGTAPGTTRDHLVQ